MNAADAPRLVLFAAAGVALGAASLTALRVSTRLYLGDGAGWGVVLHLVRLAGLVAILVMIAREGAPALLAALGGLTLARPLVVRALARAP